MSAAYVRSYYGVPAKRGGRVVVDGKPGRITGFGNGLRVRFDGEKHSTPCHPTWRVEYVDAATSRRKFQAGDPCPEDVTRVRDYQGDIWTRGDEGMWWTPETKPFGWAHIAKKWGPLTELRHGGHLRLPHTQRLDDEKIDV